MIFMYSMMFSLKWQMYNYFLNENSRKIEFNRLKNKLLQVLQV